eukprot:1141779-Pelagomonas_calceolata.AAC.2
MRREEWAHGSESVWRYLARSWARQEHTPQPWRQDRLPAAPQWRGNLTFPKCVPGTPSLETDTPRVSGSARPANGIKNEAGCGGLNGSKRSQTKGHVNEMQQFSVTGGDQRKQGAHGRLPQPSLCCKFPQTVRILKHDAV